MPLLAATICVGQQAVSDTAPAKLASPTDTQFQSRASRYKIAPGDSFDLNFELSPEFNQSGVAVQPDGFVTLRGIGDIQVKGQTVPELTQTLRTAYGKILNDPIISVSLKDFEKPYFVADGQVGKPGKYDLRGRGHADASDRNRRRVYRCPRGTRRSYCSGAFPTSGWKPRSLT